MKRTITVAMTLALSAAPAFAHLNPAEHGSLMTGLLHPFSGADHILAMVAVGLWAAQLGGKARFLIPASFLLTMAAGFAAALFGLHVPLVEPAVLASIVGLGLLVALAVNVPTVLGVAVVGAFAFFHGHAHGSELGSAQALQFATGFVIATSALHIIGLAIGLYAGRTNKALSRLLGGLTALAGVGLFFA